MTTGRYGEVVYGFPNLTYGAATTWRDLTWVLEIDWDNDGFYNGDNEMQYAFDFECYNGRTNFLKGTGDGFEPVKDGSFTVYLRNDNRRFDPFNDSSPIYPNVVPGRHFQLRVYKESTATFEPIMVGRIDDIRPLNGLINEVTITGSNGLKQMAKKVRTSVYENIRFDAALEVLLADWEYGTDIDNHFSDQMRYWWASGRPLFTEITSLVDAALGMFCIAEDGKATYKSRIDDSVPLFELNGDEIDLDYGIHGLQLWDVVKNRISVYARNRTLVSDVEIWRASEVISIPSGSSREIWAVFSYNGEEATALSVTTPVATTDYTAFQNSNGTGTNYTANVSIVITKFAEAAKMVVTNNGPDFYLTLLKIRGNVIVADKYTFAETEDQNSIDQFGEYEFVVQSDWLQDINTAQDEADILIERLAPVRKFPRVKMLPNPDKQLALRLFGLIQVNIPSDRVTGEYRIGYIKHKWYNEVGQIFSTEIYLEPNLLGNISGTWVFPAIFGETTVF